MRPHRHSPRFPSLRSGAGRADAGPAAARRRRKSKPLPSLTCVPSRLNVVVALLRSRSLSPTPTLVGVLPPRAAPTLRASPLLGAAMPRLRRYAPARPAALPCVVRPLPARAPLPHRSRPCAAPMGALRAAALAHRHGARRRLCHGVAIAGADAGRPWGRQRWGAALDPHRRQPAAPGSMCRKPRSSAWASPWPMIHGSPWPFHL